MKQFCLEKQLNAVEGFRQTSVFISQGVEKKVLTCS